MNGFDGAVHRAGDDDYEAARAAAVWNGIKPERFPAVIVVAGSHDDVPRAVALARAEGLSIGIRSGGHSWTGNAIREGGLLLDLSRLKTIEVDTDTLTAIVEPGVKSHELTTALAAHGLYFPTGNCSSVGVVGYTLGGGFGLNTAVVGPAAFNVRAVDVVTADGELLHATDEEHADVLWAARGSGTGFFAAVTRLYLEVRRWPGIYAVTMQAHPLSAYDELMAWYVEMTPAAAEAGTMPLLMATRSLLPDRDETLLALIAAALVEDIDDAREALAPLTTAPGLDQAVMHMPVHESSFEMQYALLDQMYPEGDRYVVDTVWLEDPGAQELRRDLKPMFESVPSTRSGLWLVPWHPREHPNASWTLQSPMIFEALAVYDDPAEDDAMRAWLDQAMAIVEPYSIGGGPVNSADLFTHPQAILPPAAAARLEELRAIYDPDGVFDSFPGPLPEQRRRS